MLSTQRKYCRSLASDERCNGMLSRALMGKSIAGLKPTMSVHNAMLELKLMGKSIAGLLPTMSVQLLRDVAPDATG